MTKKTKTGGYRHGSGRPHGTGQYGEKTLPLRIPVSLISSVKAFVRTQLNLPFPSEALGHQIPFYASRVAAGTPAPTDDHVDRYVDLNQYLVERPTTTFFVRAEGESMIGAGIQENDVLIVDRSIKPTNGKIIIAVVNNELTVKRLELQSNHIRLLPENPAYQPIEITEDMGFAIWGVVIHVIHTL